MVIDELITKGVMKILSHFSRKEGEHEIMPYESESVFSVHAPKWTVPLIVVYEALFGGFAVFSYINAIYIALYFFIAFCLLGFFVLANELAFRIAVDGQEIRVCRLFRATRFFQTREIVSCRTDNANNVTVSFGTATVGIASTMVNAARFYDFAWECAWHNSDSGEKQVYTIRCDKKEVIFLLVCFFVLGGLAVFTLREKIAFDSLYNIAGFCVCAALAVFIPLYLVAVLTNAIIVDEIRHKIFFRKGLFKQSADIADIIHIDWKKRFGEASAVNWMITVARTGAKPLKKTFASLDENADRLVRLLQKEWGYYDEDEETENTDI